VPSKPAEPAAQTGGAGASAIPGEKAR
jgi:hypothetical protein